MKVAVLGYGPAGLIAAKTLVDEGHEVTVMGDGPKSVIGGAQYLHANVMNPNHTEPEGIVSFLKMGERDVYAEKIYPQASTDVSWDHYMGDHPAWALGPVYDQLWGHFGDDVKQMTFNGLHLCTLTDSGDYDMVFSSIPAHALCLMPSTHGFPRVNIALVEWSPIEFDNAVVYSGRHADAWYRTSRIFGQGWTEFGASRSEAQYFKEILTGTLIKDIHRGFKPLGTNCDCHPNVVRIGRFGLWDRKVLLHHVPAQVIKGLEERV